MANEGANDVLAQIIEGFELLSGEVSSKMEPVRRVRGLCAYERKLLEMEPAEVSDICELTKCRSASVIFGPSSAFFAILLTLLHFIIVCCNAACPAGLVYAEEGSSCVNFQFEILTKELSAESVTTYSEEMTTKINAGELYDVVKVNHPLTYILGLGNPGAGTFYDGATVATAPPDEPAVTTATPDKPVLTTNAAPDAVVEEPAPKLGAAAIIFIVLAVVIFPIAIFVR